MKIVLKFIIITKNRYLSNLLKRLISNNKDKDEDFYCQESSCRGESTTAVCVANDKHFRYATELARWAIHNCSRLQEAAKNGARDGG